MSILSKSSFSNEVVCVNRLVLLTKFFMTLSRCFFSSLSKSESLSEFTLGFCSPSFSKSSSSTELFDSSSRLSELCPELESSYLAAVPLRLRANTLENEGDGIVLGLNDPTGDVEGEAFLIGTKETRLVG